MAPKKQDVSVTCISIDGESEAKCLERMGRQRPAAFSSIGSELAFGFSIMLSIIMAVGPIQSLTRRGKSKLADPVWQEYYVSGFNVIVPTLTSSLDISAAGATWPASSFTLVAGAFFLIAGRVSLRSC